MLQGLPFEGNIRELANEIERAVILADPGAPITDDLLSEHVQEAAADGGPEASCSTGRTASSATRSSRPCSARGGVKTKVAEELGITPRGLAKKMLRLGL